MTLPPEHEHTLASQVRDHDPRLPPTDFLLRYGARVLDPDVADRIPGYPPIRNTAYLTDQLLIPAQAPGGWIDLIRSAAYKFGMDAVLPEDTEHRAYVDVLPILFRPAENFGQPVAPPDAWRILQAARLAADKTLHGVGLDHLLFASPGPIGSPILGGGVSRRTWSTPEQRPDETQTSPRAGGALEAAASEEAGILQYGLQGSGGRQPVSWVGPAPMRRTDDACRYRRPVVAILDTGCGRHPWLDDIVRVGLSLDGNPIGMADPSTNPEVFAEEAGPLDGAVDAAAGHGTFMAGLVHIACPDADILAIRVVQVDGVVFESELVRALGHLAELVRRCHAGEYGGHPVDLVVLSMGYYHEQPYDGFTPVLADVVETLGQLGTIVVASAGNDATSRPMYPAAFAPRADGKGLFGAGPDRVPVVSVGASNPDGTEALFSNGGPWVRAWTSGAAVVSTMPITFRSGLLPISRVAVGHDKVRSELDPNNYGSGFAVWSGTSFSAPVLAGQMARELWQESESGGLSLEAPGIPHAVGRAWSVIERITAMRV